MNNQKPLHHKQALVGSWKARERLLQVRSGDEDRHYPRSGKHRLLQDACCRPDWERLSPPEAATEKRTVGPRAPPLQHRARAGYTLPPQANPTTLESPSPYLGTVHVETARVPRCQAAAGPAAVLARLRPGPHREPQAQVTLRSPLGPELTPVMRESQF